MDLRTILIQSLKEDAPEGDITSSSFISSPLEGKADIMAKDSGIFFGEAVVREMFGLFETPFKIDFFKYDGDVVAAGDMICRVEGAMHSLLLAERTLLNLIQRLSGVATKTRQFVSALNNPKIQILDTRKTTPLLRSLERQAVKAGGGCNHRHGLSDMVLLKENHLASIAKLGQLGTFSQKLASFKQEKPEFKIEIEIESPDQLQLFDLSCVDYILLDNFSLSSLENALEIIAEKRYSAEVEVSGNITLDTIGQYRDYPIHRVSVGSLTHSVKALDLSLLIH